MKTTGQKIFLAIVLLLAASLSAFSQDAGMSDVEILANPEVSETERVGFTPGEDLRYIPRAGNVAQKDSITLQLQDFPMQRAAQKPAEKQPAKPKDDSILTFNFLYYIIQKYKLQDIID